MTIISKVQSCKYIKFSPEIEKPKFYLLEMNNQRYDKGGTAGSKGVQFQVNLLTVFLLNALKGLADWKLSTEDKRAGKFDDVVLGWPQGAVLLQAKHRENKKRITVDELMSTNSKNDDFSLPKYFFSYQEIKDKFPIQSVIVCTNAGVNDRAFTFLKPVKETSDSMLYTEDKRSFYVFKEEKLNDLGDKAKLYCQQNLKDKGIDESVITDENLKEFTQYLQLYFEYPAGENVEKKIEKLLQMTNWLGKVSPLEIYCKVMDWFQQKDGEYITEIRTIAMFSEIQRDKYWQSLEQHLVFFQNDDLNFQSAKKVYHITAHGAHLLQEIRVYRALHGTEKKVLCVFPGTSIEDQTRLIHAFELSSYVYLVIFWPQVQEECVIKEMCDIIGVILGNYKYKKVILLTECNDKLFQQIKLSGNSVEDTRGPPVFQDLSELTRDMLLKKKNIVFQGNECNLKDLFSEDFANDYETALSSETLARLVGNERIEVGSTLGLLDENIRHLYIHRNFLRKGEKVQETDIFAVREKVVLISDAAGMGKTTILTKLALIVKERNPHLWVVRIELGHYSKILKDSLRKKKKTISLKELLDSQNMTKLRNAFEEFVFSMENKVVLMLDGVDEIRPIYTELIESLLVDCLRAPNLAKIVITTRPHQTHELEAKLRVEPFTLQPFTKRNQFDFLTSYWTQNLEMNVALKEKCERYAKALISKMTTWTKSDSSEDNHFSGVPLHIWMVAQIFQEESESGEKVDWERCKEFINSDEHEPKLPKRIDVSSLYGMFLDNKRTVFIDKSNPSGMAAAEIALNEQFEDYLSYHRHLALEAILDETEYRLFTCYGQSCKNSTASLIHIGIVQEVGNDLHFVHRTFAEYFVAQCLLKELQRRNENAEFQKFLIDDMLRDFKFKLVRNFLDNLLRDQVSILPCTVFQNYQSLWYEVEKHKYNYHNLVHDLAGEGCVATLRLLLKCVRFRTVENKETIIYELYKRAPVEGEVSGSFGNRLAVLRFFLRRGGLNIKNQFCQTPLHSAAREGHLEMVKFLVKRGCNVNVTDREGCAPLYEATRNGYLDVVEYLLKRKAIVKPKISRRGNELYVAVTKNLRDIAGLNLEAVLKRHKLERGLEAEYAMIPFAAAYLGGRDILEALVEKGLDVNCRVVDRKPLIFGAVQGGQLETFEYLVGQGANVNNRDEQGNTVLHSISKNPSHIGIAQFLVGLVTDFDIKNEDGMTALHLAAEVGALDLAELLAKSGCDVDSREKKHERTILHTATLNRHYKIVELLVKHSADVNLKDGHGDTVLHSLAKRDQLGGIKCLKKLDVDVTLRDSNGYTVLHVALLHKQFDNAKFLIDCGCDVNTTDEEGRTALHLAVSVGKKEMVESGANKVAVKVLIDDNDSSHNSMHSVIFAQLDIARRILARGAKINAKNGAEQTVLHSAILRFISDFDLYPSMSRCDRCSSLVKFLVEQGACIDEGNSKDLLVALAEEMQEQNKCCDGKSLGDILQLPLFKLLGSMSLSNDKLEPSTSTDSSFPKRTPVDVSVAVNQENKPIDHT